MATGELQLPVSAFSPDRTNTPLYKDNQGTAKRTEWYEFSGTATNKGQWDFLAPEGITTTDLKLHVLCSCPTATSGTGRWLARFQAITPANKDGGGAAGDSQAADTKSYSTDNAQNTPTVPGTVEYEFWTVISITNYDSIQPGDDCSVELERDYANAGDTITTVIKLRKAKLTWTPA